MEQTATIKAVQFDAAGRAGPVQTARVEVNDVTPPAVLSAAAALALPSVMVQFSKPVERTSAENAAAYTLAPAGQVQSASLAPDGRTVTLTLAGLPAAGTSLSVAGVRDLSPAGNAVLPASVAIQPAKPVFTVADLQTFNGVKRGFSQDSASNLPVKATDSWTINMFVYTDAAPGELTTLGGFGDDQDNSGAERYLINFKGGIEFWGSNVDVASGVPLDLGKWQMLTVSFDGSTVRVYKNGAEIKSAPATLADAQPSVKIAPAGPWGNGHKFSGKVQNFTIWNRALDPVSLRALLATGPAN